MTKGISFDLTFLCLLKNKFNLAASVLILMHILCAVGLFKVTTVSIYMAAGRKEPLCLTVQVSDPVGDWKEY